MRVTRVACGGLEDRLRALHAPVRECLYAQVVNRRGERLIQMLDKLDEVAQQLFEIPSPRLRMPDDGIP